MPYIDRDAFIKQQRELYCKDCTRRMGVKNGKLKEIYKIGEAPCRSCDLNDSLDSLDDYPEADVAPVVHAHWVGGNGLCSPYCSRCKSYAPNGKRWNACPSCTAIMDEEVDK